MLKYNINKVLFMRGIIHPFGIFMKAGLSRHTISRIINDKMKRYSAKDIERICLALKCTPNDLFEYKPDSPEQLNAGNPLTKLISSEANFFDVWNLTSGVPLDKIAEFRERVSALKEELNK